MWYCFKFHSESLWRYYTKLIQSATRLCMDKIALNDDICLFTMYQHSWYCRFIYYTRGTVSAVLLYRLQQWVQIAKSLGQNESIISVVFIYKCTAYGSRSCLPGVEVCLALDVIAPASAEICLFTSPSLWGTLYLYSLIKRYPQS